MHLIDRRQRHRRRVFPSRIDLFLRVRARRFSISIEPLLSLLREEQILLSQNPGDDCGQKTPRCHRSRTTWRMPTSCHHSRRCIATNEGDSTTLIDEDVQPGGSLAAVPRLRYGQADHARPRAAVARRGFRGEPVWRRTGSLVINTLVGALGCQLLQGGSLLLKPGSLQQLQCKIRFGGKRFSSSVASPHIKTSTHLGNVPVMDGEIHSCSRTRKSLM